MVTDGSRATGATRAPQACRGHARPPVTVLFLALLTAYCAMLIGIRLLAPHGVEHDEAEQVLLAQDLALGYGPHPPLYTWLQWLAFQTLGVHLRALVLLKGALLFAMYLFAYLAARRLGGDPGLAALSAFALALVPQIGWESPRDLTHSVLATALAAASLHVLLRVRDQGLARDRVMLGILLGLGFLAKYNFVLFALALAFAVRPPAPQRARGAGRGALLTLGVAALVAGPHLVWLARHAVMATAYVQSRLQGEPGAWSPGAAILGVGHVAWAGVRSVAPLAAAVALLAPRAFRQGARAESRVLSAFRLLERLLLALLVLLVLAAIVIGFRDVKARWLQPFLVPVPLYLVLRLSAADPTGERRRHLMAVVAAAIALLVAARLGEVWLGPQLGFPSRLHAPAAELAAQIRAAGFRQGTILAGTSVLGANLRLRFLEARVLAPELPAIGLSPSATGACLLVWNARPVPGVPLRVRDWAERVLEAPLPPAVASGTAEASLPGSGRRVRLEFLLLPRASEGCGRPPPLAAGPIAAQGAGQAPW